MLKRVLVYGMTDNPGGIETYLINTMEKMSERDIKFDFLCDFPTIAHKESIVENHSRIFYIPAKSKGLTKHWAEIYKVLKENKEYKTVYFNVLDAGAAFTMVIPWIMGKKIVTHSHNGETDKKRLHKLCQPFMKFMTSQYLACSKIAAEYMFGKTNRVIKKTILIPNAIDVNKYKYDEQVRKQKKKELGIEDDSLVICHVGRLSLQKNPFGMLEIFKEVLKSRTDAVLLSIGTGELEDEVKEYATKLGIQNNVKFMGKRSDVPELMQAADVFFLPSFYEGLPIVALEAQAAGLHCILSKNITLETDITGNVVFIDINASKEQWAKTLIQFGEIKRCDIKDYLEKSEFNINNFDTTIGKLSKCL